ncbi:MAG: serine--tRNA ligase, partial [Anaerolineales bacterium]|nr:serine--tRNA ligase [Anaerolineales bacterium]
MLDIRLIREKPDLVRQALEKRQADPAVIDSILALDERRRAILGKAEQLKSERNTVSKEIGRMKDADERQAKIAAMRAVGDKISALDHELRDVNAELNATLSTLPNLPSEKTPYGIDENQNVVLKTVGDIPQYDFEPQAHWDLGPALGVIDFERGVKISGSRFYVLSGAG